VIEGKSDPSGMFFRLVVTAAGTVAAKLTERLRRPMFHVGQIADIRIASLLNLVFGTLTDLGSTGRGVCRRSTCVSPIAPGVGQDITLGSANQGYALSPARPLELDDEMLLPATDESIRKTAERLMRAVAREFEVGYWEPEADAPIA
jgi:hypothetical protein